MHNRLAARRDRVMSGAMTLILSNIPRLYPVLALLAS
jgi:hypothetical protein